MLVGCGSSPSTLPVAPGLVVPVLLALYDITVSSISEGPRGVVGAEVFQFSTDDVRPGVKEPLDPIAEDEEMPDMAELKPNSCPNSGEATRFRSDAVTFSGRFKENSKSVVGKSVCQQAEVHPCTILLTLV